MEPWIGGLIAAGAAWASILLAIRLPAVSVDLDQMRLIGGITIALFGLQVLGLPIPGWAPLVVFGVGLSVILAKSWQQHLHDTFNN